MRYQYLFISAILAAFLGCNERGSSSVTKSLYTYPTFPTEQLREDLDVLVRQLDRGAS